MPITGKPITLPSTTSAAALAVIDNFVTFRLGDLQCIPVTGEVGIPNESRSIIQLEYSPMIVVNGIRPRFEHNKEDILLKEGTDYTISLTSAQVTLLGSAGSKFQSTAGVLPIGDEIKAFYRFQYFSNDELTSYILQSINALNARKPATAFPLESAPLDWDDAITAYVMIQVYQRILSDTTLWRKSIIFVDPQMVRDQIQNNLATSLQYWDFASKVSQRRGFAAPKSVTTRRLATQQRVTGANFRDFTIGLG